MQVPPCKCIDFHAERRSRPPNGPATIGLALTLCSSIFRTVPQEPRATRSPKPHLRNQERTFHVSSLPRKTTARISKRRRLLLGSTPSRRPQRDAPALGLAPVARPRPRARRRHAPRGLMDHSRRARLVSAAPAAVASQQRPTAPRRRAREWPKASPAFTSNDRPFCGCVSTASHVTRAHRARGAQQCQRLQQCVVAAEAARRRGQL